MDNDVLSNMLLVFGVFIYAATYYLKGGYLAVYIAGLVIGHRFVHKRSSMIYGWFRMDESDIPNARFAG